jgi:hypothetical protein
MRWAVKMMMMATLNQRLQSPHYINTLLDRLRTGKAANAMRNEAAELIEMLDEESRTLSAQNSYQAIRIEELEGEVSKLKEIADSQMRTLNALMVGMPDDGTTPVIRRIDELERQADKLRSLWDAEFRRANKAEAERDALRKDALEWKVACRVAELALAEEGLGNEAVAKEFVRAAESELAAIDAAREKK